MRNPLKKLLVLVFLFTTISASAKPEQDFIKHVVMQFSTHWKQSQQEKLYLHTDKPYYSSGESIWFKAYLVNASTLMPYSKSKLIYVELIDQSNRVISRVKIIQDSLGFYGHIKLNPALSSGIYTLRAYTYWMQNAGSDFFFKKNIFIGNNIDDNVLTDISYAKNTDKKSSTTITFTNNNKQALVDKNIILELEDNNLNKKTKKASLQTDENGKIHFQLDSLALKNKFFDVSIDDKNLQFKKRFFLPEFNSDFDVQFFPESGNLLAGQLQTIAVKAIDTDGISVEVSGKVFTAKNEAVIGFSTTHKGMGKFELPVQSDEQYYAIVTTKDGREKRFFLPTVQANGISLKLEKQHDTLNYKLTNTSSISNENLYLLIHLRGQLLKCWSLSDTTGKIPESLLPPGILSLSVVDTLGNNYCERLHFVRGTSQINISMTTDKKKYGKREPVTLSFLVQSPSGKPSIGNYSISITDNAIVRSNANADNIWTNLLLTSDLKGYVEDPAGYFTDNLELDCERLDILMLTQGWKRFNISEVLKGTYPDNNYYLEAGQSISGKVQTILKKPAINQKVIMLAPSLKYMKTTLTDSLGNFMLNGFEFPDSTSFNLTAPKKFAIGALQIIPDTDIFPVPNTFIAFEKNIDNKILNDYLTQTKEKYYTEGGMKVIGLKEFIVNANKLERDPDRPVYLENPDRRISSKIVEENPGLRVMDFLETIPGCEIVNGIFTVRKGSQIELRDVPIVYQPPLFFVNEIEYSQQEVEILEPSMIKEINVFYDAKTVMWGSRGRFGVVAITLKGPIDIAQKEILGSQVIFTPLGYQNALDFYVPKYEVDSVRISIKADLRTTIYWNPSVNTDSTGMVQVNFFTADRAHDYTVELEGISNTGIITRFVGYLKRENE